MKLVILGGSGKTGQELIKLAVERGHLVTAIVRDVSKITTAKGLHVVKADVTKAEELVPYFKGQDAVLSTLGNNNASLRLIELSTKAIVDAMDTSQVKRVVIESAYGASETATLSKLVRYINDKKLGSMLVDKKKGEAILKQSDLDWTLVYPVRLTDATTKGGAREVPATEKIGVSYKISRTDTADYMLDVAENGLRIKETPVITSA